MRDIKRIFLRVISLALIAVMLLLVASCASESSEDADGETDMSKTIEVPVFTEDIEFGKRINKSSVTTITISSSAVSSTMVTSVDDVVGKYALVPLYKGDFAYTAKLAKRRPTNALDVSEIEKTRNKFIDVSQFIEPNSGLDVYEALQKLIDNNKGRTIYFPDGEYLISKPLKTSAEGSTSTAFYLSDNAIIKALDNWKGGNDALVKMGGALSHNDIKIVGSNYYFIGGILDGNGVAKGISLDSGRETLVSKVKIINATVGIYVPDGVNNHSSDMDVEDVDIIGCGGNSKGIVSIGLDNNFTDIRISNVKIGVENSGGSFFRGISVRLEPENLKTTTYEGSVAFESAGDAWYYACSSENMETGFYITRGAPIIKDFSIRWTEARGAQNAFATVGSFSALCSNGIIDFFDETTENSILKISGNYNNSGSFLNVIADTDLCDESDYKKVFYTSRVGA